MQDVRNRDKDTDRGSLKDGKHPIANSITKDHHNSWLTEKIRECGELVGISANKKKGGWDSLIAFVHNRELENRVACTSV